MAWTINTNRYVRFVGLGEICPYSASNYSNANRFIRFENLGMKGCMPDSIASTMKRNVIGTGPLLLNSVPQMV